MKRLTLILILLFIPCFFFGCSNNKSENDNSAAQEKEDIDVTEEFEKEGEESPETDPYALPESNVKNGTGIEGTWKNSAHEGDVSTSMILALNDDNTFKFYVEIVDSSDTNPSSGSARGSGVYTVEGSELNLDFSEEPESGEQAQIIDDSKFTYELNGQQLKLTDASGETIEYIRE